MIFIRLLAVGAALCAAPALSQTPATTGHFADLDADGDGRITRLEFIRGRAAIFRRLDRNGDNALSRGDFPRAAGRARAISRIDARIAGSDLDGNGTISIEELELAGTPLFNRVDRNGDDAVDRAEIAALRAPRPRPRS